MATDTKLLESKEAKRIPESISESSFLLSESKTWRKAKRIHLLLRNSLRTSR